LRATSRSLLAGALAACVYGGWAWLVNRHAGPAPAGVAALVQGGYSFVLTLTLTASIELLVAAFGRSPPALTCVVAVAAVSLFAVAFLLQWLAATPSILAAILPGWIVGTVYAGVYAIMIARNGSRSA